VLLQVKGLGLQERAEVWMAQVQLCSLACHQLPGMVSGRTAGSLEGSAVMEAPATSCWSPAQLLRPHLPVQWQVRLQGSCQGAPPAGL
jgi:hypothetical protein